MANLPYQKVFLHFYVNVGTDVSSSWKDIGTRTYIKRGYNGTWTINEQINFTASCRGVKVKYSSCEFGDGCSTSVGTVTWDSYILTTAGGGTTTRDAGKLGYIAIDGGQSAQ